MFHAMRSALGGGKPKRGKKRGKPAVKRKRAKVSVKIKGSPEQVQSAARKILGGQPNDVQPS